MPDTPLPKTATPDAPQLGAFEWGLLLLLSLVWGGSFFFQAYLIAFLPPLTIVAGRVGFAALALWLVILAMPRLTRGGLPRDPKIWGALFTMGVINNAIPFGLIVWGQTQITGGLAAVLNATTPFFAVILAHWLTSDEKISGPKIAGIVAGIAGVAVLIGPDVLSSTGASIWAKLAVLGAAFSYAIAGIYGRRFKGQPAIVTATGQLTGSSIVIVALAMFIDRPWTLAAPPPLAWAALIALALLATAFAYILYFRILKTAGATNLMLVTLLVPVGAILLGAAFLAEAVTPRQLAGMALIFVGLAAIDGRIWRWVRRR